MIALDLQLITGIGDFAAQLMKRIFRVYPFEKIRQMVQHFRIIPTISINPLSNEAEIFFIPATSHMPLLEDVLNLVEKLSSESKKAIVIFDEFQEASNIDPILLRQLRSVMQHHGKVNYIFLGSQESLIRTIFEKKKSPFYHFGMILPLGKINRRDFKSFLVQGLSEITGSAELLSDSILDFTDGHPYYTRQLAFVTWEMASRKTPVESIISTAIEELIHTHDMDYERIWTGFNNTDKKLLIGLAQSTLPPLSESFNRQYGISATSTAFSSLKRLAQSGYVVKTAGKNTIDDPFFSQWIEERRAR